MYYTTRIPVVLVYKVRIRSCRISIINSTTPSQNEAQRSSEKTLSVPCFGPYLGVGVAWLGVALGSSLGQFHLLVAFFPTALEVAHGPTSMFHSCTIGDRFHGALILASMSGSPPHQSWSAPSPLISRTVLLLCISLQSLRSRNLGPATGLNKLCISAQSRLVAQAVRGSSFA